MWCTNCNTAFCWSTGKVLNNTTIHNPHYFEYLRKNNGTNTPDYTQHMNNNNNCGNQYNRTYDNVMRVFNHCKTLHKSYHRKNFISKDLLPYVSNANISVEYYEVFKLISTQYENFVIYVERMVQRNRDCRYRVLETLDYSDTALEEYRIDYLLKKYDEQHFKDLTVRGSYRIQFKFEISQILEMAINVEVDVLYSVLNTFHTHMVNNTTLPFFDMYTELNNLEKYVINQIEETMYTYGYKSCFVKYTNLSDTFCQEANENKIKYESLISKLNDIKNGISPSRPAIPATKEDTNTKMPRTADIH